MIPSKWQFLAPPLTPATGCPMMLGRASSVKKGWLQKRLWHSGWVHPSILFLRMFLVLSGCSSLQIMCFVLGSEWFYPHSEHETPKMVRSTWAMSINAVQSAGNGARLPLPEIHHPRQHLQQLPRHRGHCSRARPRHPSRRDLCIAQHGAQSRAVALGDAPGATWGCPVVGIANLELPD